MGARGTKREGAPPLEGGGDADARCAREVVSAGTSLSGFVPIDQPDAHMAAVGKCRNCGKTVYQLEAVTAIDKVRQRAFAH